MAITFFPNKEKLIKDFFRQQKAINKRFRQVEFIEEAILDKITNQQKPKTNAKNN